MDIGPVALRRGPDPPIANPGLRVARHRATTAHLASVHPFHGGHALADVAAPYVGVNVTDGGSAWCYDPFELYGRDLGGGMILTNSNLLVLGEPGNGKSTAVKTMLWRQAGYYGSRRFIAISDPKGEYGPLSAALGIPTVKLQPGGRDRLNPLDPGPGDRETSVLARQTLLIAMIGVALGRDLNVVEQAILAIAVTRLDERHRPARPATLVELAALLGVLPAELRAHPHLGLLTETELNASLTALRLALVRLLEQTLRGMFDGPSTVPADWTSGPGITLDLSAVFDNPEALQLVQLTANAWLSQQLAALQGQNRRGILVEDEVWATTASERSAKALQARLKLCRLYGHLERPRHPPTLGPARPSRRRLLGVEGRRRTDRRHPDQGRVPPSHRPARRRHPPAAAQRQDHRPAARADQGPRPVAGRRPQSRRPPRPRLARSASHRHRRGDDGT